jgi:hypothetical protein
MTTQLAYRYQLMNYWSPYLQMCHDGYLTIMSYTDSTGKSNPPGSLKPLAPIGYYCITDKFARDYMKGLSDALVVMNSCEVGTSRWYAALHGNGANAVVGYLEDITDSSMGGVTRAREVFADVGTELGDALFELQTAQRGTVETSAIPSGAIPAGNTADNPFNLGDSLNVANAWFPSARAARYNASLAVTPEHNAVTLAYAGDGTWGLIPHLDRVDRSADTWTVHGDFGDALGAVQGDDGSGLWALGVPILTRARNSIAIGAAPSAANLRYRSSAGLLSNALLPTGGNGYVVESYVTDLGLVNGAHEYQYDYILWYEVWDAGNNVWHATGSASNPSNVSSFGIVLDTGSVPILGTGEYPRADSGLDNVFSNGAATWTYVGCVPNPNGPGYIVDWTASSTGSSLSDGDPPAAIDYGSPEAYDPAVRSVRNSFQSWVELDAGAPATIHPLTPDAPFDPTNAAMAGMRGYDRPLGWFAVWSTQPPRQTTAQGNGGPGFSQPVWGP